MLSHVLALLVGTLLLAPGASPFSVLTAYNGNWNVVAVHPFGGGAAGVADKLENRCTETADSYRCEQTVNGSHVATVIFYRGSRDAGDVYRDQCSGRRNKIFEHHAACRRRPLDVRDDGCGDFDNVPHRKRF